MSRLIEVRRVKQYYPILGGVLRRKVADVKAVDNVDIEIEKGECFGLVGESGCGKTSLAKTILRLLKPTAGHIYYDVPSDVLERITKLEAPEVARDMELEKIQSQLKVEKISVSELEKRQRQLKADKTRSQELKKIQSQLKAIKARSAELEKRQLQLKADTTQSHELEKIQVQLKADKASILELEKRRDQLKADKTILEESKKIDVQLKDVKAKSAELEKRRRKLKAQKIKSSELEKLRNQYDIGRHHGKKLNKMRRKIQIVYQDPTTSLDPRMLVKDIVAEPLTVQKIAKGTKVQEKVIDILNKVGLSGSHLYRYAHEFSGGQRQRIAVARALVLNPEFVILDEPTSAVDVSVRAQLLNLLQDLQKEFDLTYLFVSHDLSVVECISNRVAVMYLGKIVEVGETAQIYKNPLHPYTVALFSSVPIPDPTARRERAVLSGDVPSPVNPPSGCRFHPRCSKAMDVCKREEPTLVNVGDGHKVACHLINA